MGVDNEDDIFDRWRRAFNEADTVFIELLDHHLGHPVFVLSDSCFDVDVDVIIITTSDTLVLSCLDVDHYNDMSNNHLRHPGFDCF